MPIVLDPAVPGSLTLIVDPSEVAVDRAELDLDNGPIRVDQAGIDWGDAAIQAYMADLTVGSAPVDFRLPNRMVTIPLFLGADDSGTYQDSRTALRQKVGLLQREGGWLKRGEDLFADVVNATLRLPDKWGRTGEVEPDVQLVLECLPDFYGAEVALSVHTGSGAVVFTESDIDGDHMGRLRIVVTDTSGHDQRGVVWAVRSRYHDTATTAAPSYEAEALTPLDTAASGVLSGASGGSAVTHSNVGRNWTPVLSTDLAGTGPLTHEGSYRVRVRASTTSTTPPELRFLYDVGDFTLPEALDVYTIPGSGSFYWADLGIARLDKAPLGAHRWKGVVQARGALGGENVSIDVVDFVAVAEGGGQVTAPVNSDLGLAAYSVRDEFNQTAGNLNGKTLPVGGTWVTSGADATDVTVESTGHTATRATTSDSSGKDAIAGTTVFTDTVAQCDFAWSTNDGNVQPRLYLRYTNSSNYVALVLFAGTFGAGRAISLIKVAGGVLSFIRDIPADVANLMPATWYSARAMVTSAGNVLAAVSPQGSEPTAWAIVASDSALATGGALASGKVGFRDYNGGSGACTRSIDNFAAWVPTPDAVVFANQAAELRTDGMVRLDATGSAYGPISEVEGPLPRVPPSGVEGRSVDFFVRQSRGDFDQLPDTAAADGISVQPYYRPSFLFP